MSNNTVPATVIMPGMETVETCQQVKMKRVDIECPIGKTAAARILGISTDTLDQWTARYGIPHYKYGMDGNRGNRGKVLYLPSDLLEFREKFRVEDRRIDEAVEEMLAGIGD